MIKFMYPTFITVTLRLKNWKCLYLCHPISADSLKLQNLFKIIFIIDNISPNILIFCSNKRPKIYLKIAVYKFQMFWHHFGKFLTHGHLLVVPGTDPSKNIDIFQIKAFQHLSLEIKLLHFRSTKTILVFE